MRHHRFGNWNHCHRFPQVKPRRYELLRSCCRRKLLHCRHSRQLPHLQLYTSYFLIAFWSPGQH